MIERGVNIVNANRIDLGKVSAQGSVGAAANVRTPSFCISVASRRQMSASVRASRPCEGLYAP